MVRSRRTEIYTTNDVHKFKTTDLNSSVSSLPMVIQLEHIANNISLSSGMASKQASYGRPTSPFTILEPRDQENGEFYVAQERCATDFEAQKLWKCRSGGDFWAVHFNIWSSLIGVLSMGAREDVR